MKRKKNKKIGVKIDLVVIFGFICVVATYLYCICYFTSLEIYTNNFATYCIYTLVLYDFIVIRRNQKKIKERKIENLNKIDDIKKKILSKECILDSIEIIHRKEGADYFKYDLYDNKYKKRLLNLAIFNFIILGLGFLPIIFSEVTWNGIIIFVIQIMVGIVNVIYLYIWELEQGKILFFTEKLTQNSHKKNEENINKFYDKNMTLIMHKESVFSVGNQSYYIVEYSEVNKRYRGMLGIFEILVGIAIICVAQYNGGIVSNLISENNIFLSIYPNSILLVFCYISNITFQNRINEHKVYIKEGTSENILDKIDGEQNRIYYECQEGRQAKLYMLILVELSKGSSLWIRIRKLFKSYR